MKEQEIRRVKIATMVGCLVILTLFMIRLYFQTNSSSKIIGYDVVKQQIETLNYENNILKAEIAEAESYRMIASRAAELGFEQSSKDTFIEIRR